MSLEKDLFRKGFTPEGKKDIKKIAEEKIEKHHQESDKYSDPYLDDVEKKYAKDPNAFDNTSENQTLVPNETYGIEVEKNLDTYRAEAIVQSYKKKIETLHAALTRVMDYLKAKKEFSKLEHEIESMLIKRPTTLTMVEKVNDLENYKRIIQSFEKNNIPEEVWSDAKQAEEDLSDIVLTYSQMRKVAEENPGLN